MKSSLKLLLAPIFLASLVSCATGSPPSAVERALYQVTTNFTTTVTPVAVIGSNSIVTATNYITNVFATYELHPKEAVSTSISAGGAVATGLGAPWVVPLLGLLGGLYGWWAEFRNSRKKKLNKTFGQNLETALETFKAIGGDTLRSKFKHEIKAQQVEAGVKAEAEVVADEQVNTVKAEEAATRVNKVVAVPNGP